MKKIFLISVLSALLLVCLGVAVACSSNNCVIEIDEQSFIDLGIEEQDGTWSFNPNVKKGSSKTYDVMLDNAYDVGTLKIYGNGEEAQFVQSDTYDASAPLGDWQIVGKVTFANVQKDVKVTFACEEKELSFSFKGAEGYATSKNKDLLNDFELGEQTLLQAVTEQYTYKTTYSALTSDISAGISLTGTKKKNGYYAFESYDSMGGPSASFISGTAGISNAYDHLTKERNQYRIGIDTYAIGSQNEIVVDPDGLQVQQWIFSSESGNVIEFYGCEGAQKGEAWSAGTAYANNVGNVDLKLKAHTGVTLPEKIYINGVEQELENGEYSYSFADKAPVDFIPDAELDAYQGNQSAPVSFDVRVELELDMSAATDLYAFCVTAENSEVDIDYTWDDPYYFDGADTVWMTDANYGVIFDLQNIDATFDYIITVKDGDKETIYNLKEIAVVYDGGTFTCGNNISGSYYAEKGEKVDSIYEIRLSIFNAANHTVEISFS